MSTGKGLSPATGRGHSYPTILQFTLFLENRVGQLLDVTRRFEGTRVRIVGLSITESTECALVRLVLNLPEQGRELLEQAKIPFLESDLVAVELPDSTQPMLQICTALLQAEINIRQAFPLLRSPIARPAVALNVDAIEIALELLNQKGFTLVREDDLMDDG